MAEVTVALIKELRERTGCGMMDAKRALQQNDGNVNQAIDALRKSGDIKSEKRAARDTAEGRVGVAVSEDGKTAAVVELQCETDFNAKNEQFLALVQQIARSLLADDGEPGEIAFVGGEGTVGDAVKELMRKTGENMKLGRHQRLTLDGTGYFGTYVHSDGKLGVAVALTGSDGGSDAQKALGKDLAMHAAAVAPIALDRDGIDSKLVAKEREIATDAARASGKPDNIVEKIAEGKLNAFFKETCFLEQGFVKEPKLSVARHIEGVGKELKLVAYARIRVGE